jgi:hypothetical protein
MSTALESSGGFIAGGALRPQTLTHMEFSPRRGRVRSAAKRAAVLRNLEKAKAARAAR